MSTGRYFTRRFLPAAASLLGYAAALAGEPPPTVDFNRDVRPILAAHCFNCHGADEAHRAAKLRLDVREVAVKELKGGTKAIVPGKPEGSDLVARINSADEDERMPPKSSGEQLSDAEKKTLATWIREGAHYAPHWAFVRPVRPKPPAVRNASWVRNPIDAFILARLEKENLSPSMEAERAILLRRASLDLIGLPPTPEQVKQFVNDAHPLAYERMIDRLLADPAYGERWARVWLDLARYADSAGYGSDPLRTIWRYRDWVIDAYNRNLAYDRFTIEQLAGDLLPKPTPDDLLATAFHRNTMTNTEGGTDDEEFRVAAVKDRVDVTMQVWMGLTVGCAKCHSHKFDPISQKEYYQFFAFFNQTADNDQPSEAPTMASPTAELTGKIASVDAQIAKLRAGLAKPSADAVAAQGKWEKSLATTEPWEVLAPRDCMSDDCAPLKLLDAGFFVGAGTAEGMANYSILAAPKTKGVTAFRLETLPNSVATSGAGGSVISHFAVESAAEPVGKPAAGRYLRIELPGKERMLALAEVQAFGGGVNLALKGTARQSSTAFGGEAKLAIDGNTNGEYFTAKSTTHTNAENDPWWEVDLGDERPLERVAVWNRTDGGLGGRLAGYRVLLLSAKREPVWRGRPDGFPNPKQEIATGGWNETTFVSASADFEQRGFPATDALKKSGKKVGWATSPRHREPHAAVFFAERALEPGQNLIRIRFQEQVRVGQNGSVRFRLSATRDPVALKRATLPPAVVASLDKAAAQRSVVERTALADYFRTTVAGKAVQEQIAGLEATKPKPPTVPIMQELSPAARRKSTILEKGNFLVRGAPVEPLPPKAFHGWPTAAPANRLGLALWLVDAENPLTARVAVNRYWARLFGVGIVETEEDFGVQGEPPTNLELLDWLAVEYRRIGWDTKGMLRLIVTSAAYRQSSRVTPALLEKDPRNRLLARAPRQRLEAEIVRDQALALSGLLSRKIGGPSVFPMQPPGLWQAAFNGERTWTTSAGEDRHRRALYTFWRRTVPYPSMAAFDAPSRETCTIRRSNTNTPLQAFVTLNDPVYVEAAQALARRLIHEGGSTAADRIAFGLRLCLAREPRPEQVQKLLKLYEAEKGALAKDVPAAHKLAADALGSLPPGVAASELAAWTIVANVLLNLDGVLTKG